jgi:hypothetical protein
MPMKRRNHCSRTQATIRTETEAPFCLDCPYQRGQWGYTNGTPYALYR